jgi:hypothetical protein
MELYDGATFQAGGGLVNANFAGSIPTDWVFRASEIKLFLELNSGPGFNGFAPINKAQLEFVCEPMPGYDGDPAEVYRRVWRKMSASGDKQCFFLYLNAMTYASSTLNVDCAARRAPGVFWDFLGQFSALGVTMPQGLPSKTRVGKLMQLDERIAAFPSTPEADNGPDAHHPVRKFADMDEEMGFVKNASKGQPMSEKHAVIMAQELCVESTVIQYHMKVAVFKVERKTDRNALKDDVKESGKKIAVVDYVRLSLGLASVTRVLKSGVSESSPATVKKSHLLEALLRLGVSTGKKNREVTEADSPTLMLMLIDKAGLSTSVTVLADAALAVAPALADAVPANPAPASAAAASADVDPEVAAEAELSDDDVVSETGPDDGEEVDEDDQEDELEEELDLATRLEAAVTEGACVRRGGRLRKRSFKWAL